MLMEEARQQEAIARKQADEARQAWDEAAKARQAIDKLNAQP